MTHSALLEAVLFHKAEPVSFSELEKILQISREELLKTISSLKSTLEGRGITLVTKDTEVMLRTSKEASALIEQITKDELSKDLGKAGLETLSVILYKGPISKKDIIEIKPSRDGVTSLDGFLLAACATPLIPGGILR